MFKKKDKNQLFVLGIRSVDYEIQTFRPELHRDVEIEAALRQGRPRNRAYRRIKRARDGRGADRRSPGTGIRR